MITNETYWVVKQLNNNGVLAKTSTDKEVILLGKGIGFNKKPNDQLVGVGDSIKCYGLENENESLQDIIKDSDPVFLEIASEIIAEAEKVFEQFDTNILLALADHIAFSIERIKSNLYISNPLTSDIRLLFKDEYTVAAKARKIIEDKIGFTISDDEIGYISLHIHCGITQEKPFKSMQFAQIVHQTVTEVEEAFHIHIDDNSISYARLLNHIKFLLLRLEKKEEVMISISDYTEKEFPEAFAIAAKICRYISSLLRVELSDDEKGYLALHIEKVRHALVAE